MRTLFAALLLLAAPSLASGLASRSASDERQETGSLEGIYAGVGGGGEFLAFAGNAYFGYGLEAKLGYSFNAQYQVYLSGAFDDAASGDGPTFNAEQVAVFLQYHLLVRPAVMVFARGGVGVGLSGKVVNGYTAAGFAEGGGLGVEIRLAPGLFLSPELFYRGSTLSAQGSSASYQVVGLQLSITFY
jgi:hypothetical protein